jgi:hypothetical protein
MEYKKIVVGQTTALEAASVINDNFSDFDNLIQNTKADKNGSATENFNAKDLIVDHNLIVNGEIKAHRIIYKRVTEIEKTAGVYWAELEPTIKELVDSMPLDTSAIIRCHSTFGIENTVSMSGSKPRIYGTLRIDKPNHSTRTTISFNMSEEGYNFVGSYTGGGGWNGWNKVVTTNSEGSTSIQQMCLGLEPTSTNRTKANLIFGSNLAQIQLKWFNTYGRGLDFICRNQSNMFVKSLAVDYNSVNMFGTVNVNGTTVHSSDERKKENIKPYCPNADLIKAVEFDYKEEWSGIKGNVGYIAQEVEKFPQFTKYVHTDKDGWKSVNYLGIHTAKLSCVEDKLNKQIVINENQHNSIEKLLNENIQQLELNKDLLARLEIIEKTIQTK